MNGFERRTEQKKEKIVQAALELFKLYGFDRVSVNDVAHKAKVARATIYNHFGSKEGLVREAIKNLFLSLLEKYRTVIYGEGSFVDKLEFIVFDRIEMLSQYQGELEETLILVDPDVKQFVTSLRQHEFKQLTINLFEEGKKEGYVNPKMPDESILAYYEILRRGILASSSELNTENNQGMVQDLMTFFLYGLAAKSE